MKYVLSAAAVLALAGAAQAAFFIEAEANNTPATANFLGVYGAGDAILVDGTITPGRDDNDWFSFTLLGPAIVKAAAFNADGAFSDNFVEDSFMELYDPAFALVDSDDDDSIGFWSAVEGDSLVAGTWYINMTWFFNTPAFNYKLLIGFNVVPTPGAAALLGLGGLVAARRRR